ncbi:PaaI family thioesterase [Paenibacillus beijingensis]|uniref:Thioesterase domain-containing protein n=1 Tax=Paenibacillus beijingensis TaxID=1126833 RepID=A0A0D5NLT7_9BACL|nr:PaaI family thioesterase [Paenibacillus beijingensis]AJY75972.1 hypothetical protein VN24_17190 [Paenibacillus beijingensis]
MEASNTTLFDLLGFEISYNQEMKTCGIACSVHPLMLNPLQIVHGGIHAYLADTAFGYLTMKYKDAPYVSLEIKTSFLKAENKGRLLANARFVKDGNKVVFLACEVENEQHELLSVTTGTFLRLGSG